MQTVELVGRLLISLAVVIGLIYLVARKARGGSRRKLRSDRLIDVLGRQSLSRSSSVAVVRVADKALIVGVTDSSVRVLAETELDAVQAKLAELDPQARRTGPASPAGSARRTVFRGRRGTGYDDVLAGARFDAALDADAGFDAGPGPVPGAAADPVVPATAAELIDSLTTADLEAIRRRRAAAGNTVIPAETGHGRRGRAPTPQATPPGTGALAGSALSPATWRQTIDALREMTVRKG